MHRNYEDFYKSQTCYGVYYRYGQLEYEVIDLDTKKSVFKNESMELCQRYIWKQFQH